MYFFICVGYGSVLWCRNERYFGWVESVFLSVTPSFAPFGKLFDWSESPFFDNSNTPPSSTSPTITVLQVKFWIMWQMASFWNFKLVSEMSVQYCGNISNNMKSTYATCSSKTIYSFPLYYLCCWTCADLYRSKWITRCIRSK